MTTLLLFLAGISTAHADPDQVVFRGIKWGADCSKVRGFQPVKNSEGTEQLFERDGDKMKLGSMPLTSIRYLCISDKFVEVQLIYGGTLRQQVDFETSLDEVWGTAIIELVGKKGKWPGNPKVWGGREGRLCYTLESTDPACPAVLATIEPPLLTIVNMRLKQQMTVGSEKERLREAAERIKQDL
jgi:hypothetical protein